MIWGRLVRDGGPGGSEGTCRACGVCCDLYGHTLHAAAADLGRWQAQGRRDLLARVGPEGELWWDPDAGVRLDHCPFFSWRGPDHGSCAVHDTKPATCRAYPTALHRDRCVMGVEFGSGRGAPDVGGCGAVSPSRELP